MTCNEVMVTFNGKETFFTPTKVCCVKGFLNHISFIDVHILNWAGNVDFYFALTDSSTKKKKNQ